MVVLLHDVGGDGEEIGLGTSNVLVTRSPQEAQKDFLSEIGDVRGIPDAKPEEPAQAPTVFLVHAGDEPLSVGGAQPIFRLFLVYRVTRIGRRAGL